MNILSGRFTEYGKLLLQVAESTHTVCSNGTDMRRAEFDEVIGKRAPSLFTQNLMGEGRQLNLKFFDISIRIIKLLETPNRIYGN